MYPPAYYKGKLNIYALFTKTTRVLEEAKRKAPEQWNVGTQIMDVEFVNIQTESEAMLTDQVGAGDKQRDNQKGKDEEKDNNKS